MSTDVLAFDCETLPFGPGNMAPDVIATGACLDPAEVTIGPTLDIASAGRTCGFAVSYDSACLARRDGYAQWFRAYDAGHIVDLRIRALLYDYATVGRKAGGYSLDDVSRDAGVRPHACKDSPWRTRFGELKDIHPRDWPEEARLYLSEDVRITRELADVIPPQAGEQAQSRYDFALRLVSNEGLRVDPTAAAALGTRVNAIIARCQGPLIEAGMLRKDGSKNIAAIRERAVAAGGTRRTKGGAISTSGKALRPLADPVLQLLGYYLGALAVRDRELKILDAEYVHTRFDLAVTTRTRSSNPNLQNLSKRWGVRECFAPRAGHVFLNVDYPALELRTLAQVMCETVGPNALADAFRGGADPHLMFAGRLGADVRLGPKHPDVAPLRTLAKAANFGFPGGLTGPNFALFAFDSYGVRVDNPEALERAWFQQWPEVLVYRRHMGRYARVGRPIVHERSGHVRGRCTNTQASNSPFQERGAQVAKATLYDLVKATRVGDLAGSHVVAFVHDEYLLETPIELAEAHAATVERIIRARWPDHCPDVPLGDDVEVQIKERWSK